MLIQAPLVLPNKMDTLYLPQDPSAMHPRKNQVSLLLCHLSGNICRVKEFHRQLPTLSCSPGVQARGSSKKWMEYCSKRKIDPISPPVASVINFLAELYHKGLSYSALNTARSTLASVIVLQGNQSFGNHPLVSQFLKGTFTTRPALPK